MREVLNSERFVDLAPRQVYGTLLDEGEYYCSISSMYRILGEHDEVNERRQQRTHPTYTRPELLATAPNQVWSWDITWLRGPGKWQHFYLYVILDVFSRYVVGWLLAEEEAGYLAEQLIAETCRKQGIATRPAHAACRPWRADDLADGGPAAGGTGCGQEPLAPAYLR